MLTFGGTESLFLFGFPIMVQQMGMPILSDIDSGTQAIIYQAGKATGYTILQALLHSSGSILASLVRPLTVRKAYVGQCLNTFILLVSIGRPLAGLRIIGVFGVPIAAAGFIYLSVLKITGRNSVLTAWTSSSTLPPFQDFV